MTAENSQGRNSVPDVFRGALEEIDDDMVTFLEGETSEEREYEFGVNYHDVQYFSNVFERVKPELLECDKTASTFRQNAVEQIERIARRLKVAESSSPAKDKVRFSASVSDMDFIEFRVPNVYDKLPYREKELCKKTTRSLLNSFREHLRDIGDEKAFKKKFPGESFKNWWKLK